MIDTEKWNELDEEFSRIVDEAKSKWDINHRHESYFGWIMNRCAEVLKRHELEARLCVEMPDPHTIIIQHCPTWVYR
jgi:hypothetical protein